MDAKIVSSQQQLFPQPLDFTPGETTLLNELLPDLHDMGFDISPFGANTFVLHGAPEEVIVGTEKKLLHGILDQYVDQRDNQKLQPNENLATSIARQLSIKSGQALSTREMKELVTDLLACENPKYTPSGKPIIARMTSESIANLFGE